MLSKKQYLFIFITLLVIFALLLSIYLKNGEQESLKASPVSTTTMNIASSSGDVISTSTLPLMTDSRIDKASFLQFSGVSSCEGMSDQLAQEKCFKQLNDAMSDNSPAACDKLKDPNDQLVCAKNEYIKEAISEGSLDNCNEFVSDDDRVGCAGQVYLSQAIWKKDKKFCYKIKNENDRNNCLEVAGKLSSKVFSF